MVNIILATHGELGRALIEAAQAIAGPQEHVFAVSLLSDESPEAFSQKLASVLEQTANEQTLLVVDLFGGTPYNIAARAALAATSPGRVACVTGVNLPLLLELLLARDTATSLTELAETGVQAGRDSIKNLSTLLRRPS